MVRRVNAANSSWDTAQEKDEAFSNTRGN